MACWVCGELVLDAGVLVAVVSVAQQGFFCEEGPGLCPGVESEARGLVGEGVVFC